MIRLEGFSDIGGGISFCWKGKDTVIDYLGDTIAIIKNFKFDMWQLRCSTYGDMMIGQMTDLFIDNIGKDYIHCQPNIY